MVDRSFGKKKATLVDESKGFRDRNEARYCVEWGRFILAAKLLWPARIKELDAFLTEIHRREGKIYSEERYLKPCRIFASGRRGYRSNE